MTLTSAAARHLGECLICAAPLRAYFEGMFDDRFGHPGEFGIARCPECGFMSTEPRFAEGDLPDLYARYYPRRRTRPENVRRAAEATAVATRRGRFRAWLWGQRSAHHEIAAGMRVLDYGCGDCGSLLEIRALGGEPYGVEVDPNVREIAAALGVPVHVGTLDTLPPPDGSFDAVTFSQVIEHVPDPAALLRGAHRRLRPDGMVAITTPNSRALSRWLCGRRWLNWHIPFHQNHFDARVLRRLLEGVGFRVTKCRTFTPVPWWEYQAELLMRPASRGRAHPYFGHGESALGPYRFGRKLMRLARMAALPLARAIDLCRLGDSLLVVARKSPGGRFERSP